MKRTVLMCVGLIAFSLASNAVLSAEQKIELKAAEMKGAKGDAVGAHQS